MTHDDTPSWAASALGIVVSLDTFVARQLGIGRVNNSETTCAIADVGISSMKWMHVRSGRQKDGRFRTANINQPIHRHRSEIKI